LPFDSEFWPYRPGEKRYGWSVGHRMLQGRILLRFLLFFRLDANYLKSGCGIEDAIF
jgi:hypothetical protein